MSLVEVLKQQVGKRVVCVHSEGEKTHSLVGVVKSVDKDVLEITTDFGVKNVIPLRCVLKIKEVLEVNK